MSTSNYIVQSLKTSFTNRKRIRIEMFICRAYYVTVRSVVSMGRSDFNKENPKEEEHAGYLAAVAHWFIHNPGHHSRSLM